MDDSPQPLRLPPLTLHLIQNATKRVIPRSVEFQSDLWSRVDTISQALIVEMSTHVLADKVTDGIVTADRWYEEWESWWQHTKGACSPLRWLSERMGRPPRQRRVRVSVEVRVRQFYTFPEAQIYPVPLGRPVQVEQIDWTVGDE